MFSTDLRDRQLSRRLRPIVNTWRLFGQMWREQPWATVGLISTLVARGMIPALELLVLGRFVDQAKEVAEGTVGIEGPVTHLVQLLGLMVARNWLQLLGATLEDYLRDGVSETLQRQVYEKSSRLEFAFFEREESYNQLQRTREALGLRFANILSSTLAGTQHAVTIAALFATLALAHPLLGPAIVAAALPTLWFKLVRTRHQFGWAFDVVPLRRRMAYFLSLATERRSAKEARLFGLSSHFRERWETDHRIYREGQLDQARREMRVQQSSSFLLNLVFAGAALYLVYRVTGGDLTVGTYVVLVQAVIRLQGEANSLMNLAREVYLLSLHSDNLFDFLDRPVRESFCPDSESRRSASSKRRPFPSPLREGIRFEDVWFRYPGSDDWALQGATFTLRAGETLSLVGRNGAGKSTLVKLLVGLYHPQKGHILFDGVPLEEIDEDDLRAHMSAVFQDFAKFELTLRESIGLGNVRRIGDMDHIKKVATLAGVDEIVRHLDDGFDTVLSKRFGGTDLSGGQWQKVAVARSLMREAEVLILDEPTASLDPRAEVAVFEEFERLSAGRTTLLISHRIGTARLADRIVVIGNGRIIESGDHDHLVRAGGEYAELFQLQKQWYVARGEEADVG